MTRALVLFAHGARDPRWAEPFEAIAARVREAAAGATVRLAFLELMAPSLADAVDALVADGVDAIDVVPLFLGTGSHLRRDLPALADAVRAGHPGVELRLHAAIGEDASVHRALASAALAAAGFRE